MKNIAIYNTQPQHLENSIIENQDYLNQFIIELDVNKKSKTVYKQSITQFFYFIQNKSILELKRLDILNFKNHLKDNNKSPFTINTYLVAIKQLFKWLESKKIYPNIANNIKGVKQPRGFKKDVLTVSQIKKILNSINRDTLQGKRDYAILNLLVRTGLRIIEIQRANIEDIRQQGGEALLYIQGKGRSDKDDFVLLTEDTLTPIKDYLNARKYVNEYEPLFSSTSNRNNNLRLTINSISRLVKTRLRNVGIDEKKLTAHSFRHTAITLSLLSGASIQETKELARHSNINTTLIYAHNINRVSNAPEKKIESYLNDCFENKVVNY
jgi:integrase/recombinase XerC/integrase/recombinase XerD